MELTLIDILSAEEIDSVRRPIAQARTLPREAFTSDSFFELEKQMIYLRNWIAALFESDAPSPGDSHAFTVMDMPLIAVRDETETLRVFHNICPYDGCTLQISGNGDQRKLVSPYHGWEYDLQGQLNAIPFWDGIADCPVSAVDDVETALVEVPSQTFLGAVFLDLGESRQDFNGYVEPIERQFPEYDFSLSTVAVDSSGAPIKFEDSCATNWKTFFENSAINILHENFVHAAYRPSPQTPRSDGQGEKTYFELMDDKLLGLGFSASAFAETYPDTGLPHLGVGGEPPDKATFATLYPNFYISIMPSFLEVAFALPLGPEQTFERKQFRVHRDVAADPSLVEVKGAFAQAAAEDGAICEAVQLARNSPVYSQRIFSPYWDVLHHRFSNILLDELER